MGLHSGYGVAAATSATSLTGPTLTAPGNPAHRDEFKLKLSPRHDCALGTLRDYVPLLPLAAYHPPEDEVGVNQVRDDDQRQTTSSTETGKEQSSISAEPQSRSSDRSPHPCQASYAKLRAYVLAALAKPRRSRWGRGIRSIERAIFLVLDVPARWLMDIADTILGNRGHVLIGSALAAYFVVFGLVDAKSTQEEARASAERNQFITLVGSGSPASFVSAMKEFGSVQTMRATLHPLWYRFWDWGKRYQPNMEPLHAWARWRLGLCNQAAKDCSWDGRTRVDLSLADLSGADLSGVDLNNADLSFADLSGARLFGIDLSGADLSDANLTNVLVSEDDLMKVHKNDSDLINLEQEYSKRLAIAIARGPAIPFQPNFSGAKYNQYTVFSSNLDPYEEGMVKVDSP
jgi:hypothetical protein